MNESASVATASSRPRSRRAGSPTSTRRPRRPAAPRPAGPAATGSPSLHGDTRPEAADGHEHRLAQRDLADHPSQQHDRQHGQRPDRRRRRGCRPPACRAAGPDHRRPPGSDRQRADARCARWAAARRAPVRRLPPATSTRPLRLADEQGHEDDQHREQLVDAGRRAEHAADDRLQHAQGDPAGEGQRQRGQAADQGGGQRLDREDDQGRWCRAGPEQRGDEDAGQGPEPGPEHPGHLRGRGWRGCPAAGRRRACRRRRAWRRRGRCVRKNQPRPPATATATSDHARAGPSRRRPRARRRSSAVLEGNSVHRLAAGGRPERPSRPAPAAPAATPASATVRGSSPSQRVGPTRSMREADERRRAARPATRPTTTSGRPSETLTRGGDEARPSCRSRPGRS